MKNILPLIFLFACAGCSKTKLPSDLPDCIRTEIINNEHNLSWTIGEINEYQFQGKIVYDFIPDTRISALSPTIIKTSSCTQLCSLWGYGFNPVVLCNGEGFSNKAIIIRRIWKKP